MSECCGTVGCSCRKALLDSYGGRRSTVGQRMRYLRHEARGGCATTTSASGKKRRRFATDPLRSPSTPAQRFDAQQHQSGAKDRRKLAPARQLAGPYRPGRTERIAAIGRIRHGQGPSSSKGPAYATDFRLETSPTLIRRRAALPDIGAVVELEVEGSRRRLRHRISTAAQDRPGRAIGTHVNHVTRKAGIAGDCE